MKKTIILLNLIVFLFALSSCKQTTSCRKLIYAMDTVIEVTLYNTDESHLTEIKSIYDRYSLASDMFSEGSDNAWALNDKRSIEGSEELVEIIDYALEKQKNLQGYFNILIGGLSQIWKKALHIGDDTFEASIPSKESIDEQLAIMRESSLSIEGNIITIIGDAMVDLGGVAKGYATLKVDEYLSQNNITSYMINAGNSNVLLGNKNNDDSFIIGLKNVENTEYYRKLKIKNKALVTSSIAEQKRMIDGVLYTHILNPLTGYSSNMYDIITLIGEDSAYLDILSTALFVMELEAIKQITTTLAIDVLVVKNNEVIYSSPGVDSYA